MRLNYKILLMAALFNPAHILGQPLPPQSPKADSGLQILIEEALANNPDLKSWEAKIEALEQIPSQAGAWSDPALSLGLANLPANSFDFDREAMTAFWITGSQSLPLTKAHIRQSEIAKIEIEKGKLSGKQLELSIAKDVAHNWFDRAFLQSSIQTLEEMIELTESAFKVMQRKYETGQTSQSDLFRTEIEILELWDGKLKLEQMEMASAKKLAVLLGRKPEDYPPQSGALSESFIPVDYGELEANLSANSYEMNHTRQAVLQAQKKIDLEKSLYWPELKLSAGYGFRQDADNGTERPDFFSITAGISLPVFAAKKQNRRVEEARASLKGAEYNLNSVELRLLKDLSILVDEDHRLEKQIDLYGKWIIPQAEAAFSSAMAAYTVGKVDIEALLAAEKTLLKAKLQRLAYLRDRAKVRAALAELSGFDVTSENQLDQ